MKKIKLTQGKYAIVDDDKFNFLNQWRWFAHKSGRGFYATRNDYSDINKPKSVKMHVLLANPIKGLVVDHINHNSLDNRLINLRLVSYRENAMNRRKNLSYVSSPYKGVSRHTRKSGIIAWRARIGYLGKKISLGVFKNQIDAAKAYNKKAKTLFGEYLVLNKI